MAKNSTAHKVHSYCTLAISTAHFVSENTILGPGSRSSKVIDFGTNWKPVCDFLLAFSST